jgi:hypothetical protein
VQGAASSLAVALAAQHDQALTAGSRVTVRLIKRISAWRARAASESLLIHTQAKDATATAGKGWFDMQKPVMTKELAVDLKILQV